MKPPLIIECDTREIRPLPLAEVDPSVQVERTSLGLRGADYRIKGLVDARGMPIALWERKGSDLRDSLTGSYPRVRAELIHVAHEIRPMHRCILVEKSKRAFYEEVMARGGERAWDAIDKRMDTIAFKYAMPFIWKPSPVAAAAWLIERAKEIFATYSNPQALAAASWAMGIAPAGIKGGATIGHDAALARNLCPKCLRELPKTAIKPRDGREHCPCGRVVTLPRR